MTIQSASLYGDFERVFIRGSFFQSAQPPSPAGIAQKLQNFSETERDDHGASACLHNAILPFWPVGNKGLQIFKLLIILFVQLCER